MFAALVSRLRQISLSFGMMNQKTLFSSTVLLLLLLYVNSAVGQTLNRYDFSERHMGSDFGIILYAENDSIAEMASDAAYARIEELNGVMSDYVEESELNRLSQSSGSGERVFLSEDLYRVLSDAQWISYQTDGLFDVTIGPMTRSWRELRRSANPALPPRSEQIQIKERVGYEHLVLNHENLTARLLKKHMSLDLGGIGKGFAAVEAMNVLKSFDIQSALIDAGGDVTLGDPPPGRETWTTAVPKRITRNGTEVVRIVAANRSVATSGDLYQFAMVDGVRYSHILDPKTGVGSTLQIQATVISKLGTHADAYASVLSLMRPEKGIELIDQIMGTEAILFVKSGDKLLEFTSSGISGFLMESDK
jgi:thiamine biosynthesis lipoprotein